MTLELYWVEIVDGGRLGVMPRPRGGDWLEDEIAGLVAERVGVVVSLLTAAEVESLELEREAELCEGSGIAYRSFPIADRGEPESKAECLALVRHIRAQLAQGASVVIHCRQGIGRSAIIAACVLVSTGAPVETAFGQIATARGCAVPDTPAQRRWVETWADYLRLGPT